MSEHYANLPRNHAGRLRRLDRLGRALALIGLGVALAVVFPPLEWGCYAWLGLVPLLAWLDWRPQRPFWSGYLFGWGHFAASFIWLREVFVLAPFGLALVCALFPALWAWGVVAFSRRLCYSPADERLPATGRHARPARLLSGWRAGLFVLWTAASWTALEWCRGWFCTGFPWDLLGMSQHGVGPLLELSRYTGVYGSSFLVVAVNAAAWVWLRTAWPDWQQRRYLAGAAQPWPLGVTAALAIILLFPVLRDRATGRYALREPDATWRVALIQGDIPQIRHYEQAELLHAAHTYVRLSTEAVAAEQPELVVWPETAVPYPLNHLFLLMRAGRWEDLSGREPNAETDRWLAELRQAWPAFAELHTPLLAGTVDYRQRPGGTTVNAYNSAMLYDRQLTPSDWYDKMQIVPFGEFTPFSAQLPWLVKLIGMGRDLSRGREHTVMLPRDDVRLGVNICYEDIFPQFSRAFVLRRANVLATITNDAWYGRTSASRQHLLHAKYRAVESHRPLIRSGNNADSCLILPDGSLVQPLVDPETGSPFYRGWRVYEVPVHTQPPLTFYSRYGNLFAHLCTWLWGLGLGWVGYRVLARKRWLRERVKPEGAANAKPGKSP